nr:MAG TPA: hypothetical protein [Caudoviricetes sp.]
MRFIVDKTQDISYYKIKNTHCYRGIFPLSGR